MSPTRMDPDVVAEFKSGIKTQALTFSANGGCVVSGDGKNVRVWRVSDGKEIKRLAAGPVNCLAVSRDGRWVAAGTLSGDVIVWDVQQGYRKAFSRGNHYVVALDFSPDSRQLLTACFGCTTTIFDVAKHKHVLTLHHHDEITAAKYSQQGDRFAVATSKFIRIYNMDNFDLSVVIKAAVTPWYNTGLLWSNDQLFIISESRIKQIDSATGSVASEWPVPDSDTSSCIALPRHGGSIVYSTKHGVTIWETSSEHRQLDVIQHRQMTCSIAISSDDQYLAIGGEMGKIVVRYLPRSLFITPSTDPPMPDPPPSPSIPPCDLEEWVREELSRCSWQEVLPVVAFANPSIPGFTICRAICEYLNGADRMKEAADCFRQAASEPTSGPDLEWIVCFKLRCTKRLERLGDISMNTQHYDEAISWYSAALSLELEKLVQQGLLVKRSKAYVAAGSWEDALEDADQVIATDPSSPYGYEIKHAALHQGGDYEAAITTFETMLSVVTQSPDPKICELQSRYINPADTKAEIRRAIKNVIRGTPRVLIDTESGRLFDKAKRAVWFESLPIFKELVSAMTTQIDVARINQEVAQYYRYATLSHTWEEDGEPTFKKVTRVMVYDLTESSTHDKLKMFCEIVRKAGFHWAWSDTCCINKSDNVVLQEALVAMFRWYESSSLTIIYLRGVRSPSQRGDLVGSIWNTRAWTFQEYHASKVVRFYGEDWKPYLDLDVPNHMESPEIISEMEEATRVSVRALKALKPGLNDIREKLCLASGRETTYVEDEAFSLLGIFSQSLTIVYGEGDKALGRLLSQLLTNSGDTSILAWTGKSGSFNSCLPANISVFSDLQTTHIPSVTKDVQIHTGIQAWLHAFTIFSFVTGLHGLPLPMFVGQRMKLPCITFNVKLLSTISNGSRRVFSAQTDALGTVEIDTDEDLNRLGPLCLAHPWIDFLLDRQPVDTTTRHSQGLEEHTYSSTRPPPSPSSDVLPRTHQWQHSHELHAQPRASDAGPCKLGRSISLPENHWQARALGIVSRLRQPFGALLLAQNRPNVEEYRRVAAESMIRVQVKETASLKKVIGGVRVLDVV